MRVWLINHYALLPSQPGGTRHYTLARELIKRGHEATVVAASYNHLTRRKVAPGAKAPRYEVAQGVPFLWLPTPEYQGNGWRRVRNMASFARQVWAGVGMRRLRKPDVIIGSSPHPFAALAAESLARRWGVPFILEVRDIWPQSLVDLGGLQARHPLVYCLERLECYLYRRAGGIISLLPAAMEHIEQRGGRGKKAVWIPNGVDLGAVPLPRPPAEDGVLTVMYAGAHGLANGLDTVLDAAIILQKEGWGGRVRFKLLGDGPEKRRLQQRAEAEHIDLVTFLDPVPKGEVYGAMEEADAFLMLLKDSPVFRWGVSPNKLYDYLALARPVVFGVSTPINPVATAEAGITVSPEHAPALAQAIRTLAQTPPAERRQMGLRGRRYVEEHHDLTRLAERLEQLLTDAIRGRLA